MAQYSIKDLERLSGIKAHTIRIWEKRYNLVNPDRTDTNIRTYTDDDLKKILNVSILNKNGVKISHITRMSDEQLSERIQIISGHSSDYESFMQNLVLAMVDLDEDRIEDILSRAIMQIGFEECILEIVYPFLEKIGTLWQTGAINPAQEHFVSNLIRQKLIVAIDSLIPAKNPEPRHFLLYLPEGELHELGLLFYSYLLKKRGHKVTYLGQWVPLRDMLSASSVLDLDCLLTSVISVFSSDETIDYINEISRSFPEIEVFISGPGIGELKDHFPSNITPLQKAVDLLPHIS